MKPVNVISGKAAPYPGSNVDTDEIVPARFLYRDRREGFGDTLFRDLRFDENGNERASFVLNQSRYRGPVVVVAGSNFGCGSSREHAVWALLDYGIAAVIAPSFGDIFRNNALQNGLLPIVLSEVSVSELLRALVDSEVPNVSVNLETQSVVGPEGSMYTFDIDPQAKKNLLAGLSSIDRTLALQEDIDQFEQRYRAAFPWSA